MNQKSGYNQGWVKSYDKLQTEKKKSMSNQNMPMQLQATSKVGGGASDTLDRYSRKPSKVNNSTALNRKTSSVSKDAHFSMKPANSSKQFKKYLLDTQNVFYEESSQFVRLQQIKNIIPIIVKMFAGLLVFFCLLTYIEPYEGNCPANADCGVYIHCHRGYQLKDGRCHISEQARNQAKQICISAVENLKQRFGSKDCDENEINPDVPPSRQIYEIIQQFQVDSRATSSEIYLWFQNQTNQDLNDFTYDSLGLRPLIKKYSFTCSVKLFVRSPYFPLILTAIIILSVSIGYLIQQYLLNIKAQQVYKFLKAKFKKQNSDIVIDHHEIFAGTGHKVSSRLWEKVDKIRYKQQQIVYFEDQCLHWRKL